MRMASITIVMTIAAATAITTTPSTMPTVQPVMRLRPPPPLDSRPYLRDWVVSTVRGAYSQTTMKRSDQARRADELAAAREPFVNALVVRASRPTSVHAGDCGLVRADGSIEGFVGGACAETSVRLHALRALETGESLVLRIVPGDSEGAAEEGAVTVQNPCLSGGALEIFLQPSLPAPRVGVVGETPIAGALVSLAGGLGYESGEPSDEDVAVVVAAHG